jgi:hypothetical protein
MVTIPLWSPSGKLLGFEARSRFEKKITEFLLPESSWNPVFIGSKEAATKLWAGGSVWVVEGLYDLAALSWVIPASDAVVATLKAGLSQSHVRFFARFCTNRVYMVYDNDDAGRHATTGFFDPRTGKWRPGALDLLKKAGVTAVDYRYRGKDPGEVWSKGGLPNLMSVFEAMSG